MKTSLKEPTTQPYPSTKAQALSSTLDQGLSALLPCKTLHTKG